MYSGDVKGPPSVRVETGADLAKQGGQSRYEREGGERPEVLVESKGMWKYSAGRTIPSPLNFKCPNGEGRTANVEWVPCAGVACGARAALAIRRQLFRFPEAASMATISGCRSSVREIAGSRSDTTQPMATASTKTRARGFCRDASQRKRQTERAASATISHIRLRRFSIVPPRRGAPCESIG